MMNMVLLFTFARAIARWVETASTTLARHIALRKHLPPIDL